LTVLYDPPKRQSKVEMMRYEIGEIGESIVACEELHTLCADELSTSGQWNCIAKLAIDEGWSFTFFPNGSVRFARL